MPTLCIAQDPAADELLGPDPLGLLFDQPMRQRRRRALPAAQLGQRM